MDCFWCRFPIEGEQTWTSFKRKKLHSDTPDGFKSCLDQYKRHREVITPQVKRKIKQDLARADSNRGT